MARSAGGCQSRGAAPPRGPRPPSALPSGVTSDNPGSSGTADGPIVDLNPHTAVPVHERARPARGRAREGLP